MKRFKLKLSSTPIKSTEELIQDVLNNKYIHPFRKWMRIAKLHRRMQLMSDWTVAPEQEIINMHGIDVNAELTTSIANELQAEINRSTKRRRTRKAAKRRSRDSKRGSNRGGLRGSVSRTRRKNRRGARNEGASKSVHSTARRTVRKSR